MSRFSAEHATNTYFKTPIFYSITIENTGSTCNTQHNSSSITLWHHPQVWNILKPRTPLWEGNSFKDQLTWSEDQLSWISDKYMPASLFWRSQLPSKNYRQWYYTYYWGLYRECRNVLPHSICLQNYITYH